MTQSSRSTDRLSRGLEPVDAGEWFMVGLAAVNVLLLFAVDAYAVFLPTFALELVVPIDLGLLAIFALEFAGRLAKADDRLGFVKTHWYDAVGLVPITGVPFRAIRLVRLVRMYVVARLDWEQEATWHTAFVRGVILRYRDVLLDEITDPIVVAGIKVVKAPLKKARFASVMGTTIDNQRRQVHAVVRATLENTKGMKRFTATAPGRKVQRVITEAVLDTVVDTLKSDEMNELLANSVEDVLDEVHRNVKEATIQASGGHVHVQRPQAPVGPEASAEASPKGSRARARGP